MYCIRTDVGNFRLKRKCSTFSGHWLFMLGTLVLLLSYVSCRPANEEFDGFPEEYADVDNVEWHHVKIVDGVLQPEDHPVIFYKEDFVSEDYDPAKERHKNATDGATAHRPRKYKEISRRHRYNRTDTEQYRALEPEKIYFDVLPQTPVVIADDSGANDSKFDASKIRVEVLSLADDTTDQESEDEATKQILSKRPKKYRRRQRRDTSADEHRILKRNPHYALRNPQNYGDILLSYLQTTFGRDQTVEGKPKNTVRGKYHNAISLLGPTTVRPQQNISIGTRIGAEEDRVVWSNRPTTERPQPPPFRDLRPQTARPTTISRPIPPLFHDSNPDNWDTSFISASRRPAQPTSTARPIPPLFHDSNPDNWDTSFLITERPTVNGGSASSGTVRDAPPARSAPEPQNISDCVWAIVHCCSGERIRNECFESMNCGKNFWGLNPCSDKIRGKALNQVGNFLD